jgi:hypothetical protein
VEASNVPMMVSLLEVAVALWEGVLTDVEKSESLSTVLHEGFGDGCLTRMLHAFGEDDSRGRAVILRLAGLLPKTAVPDVAADALESLVHMDSDAAVRMRCCVIECCVYGGY